MNIWNFNPKNFSLKEFFYLLITYICSNNFLQQYWCSLKFIISKFEPEKENSLCKIELWKNMHQYELYHKQTQTYGTGFLYANIDQRPRPIRYFFIASDSVVTWIWFSLEMQTQINVTVKSMLIMMEFVKGGEKCIQNENSVRKKNRKKTYKTLWQKVLFTQNTEFRTGN